MTKNNVERRSVLPPSLPPRGLRREEAAAYICLSPSAFDAMVADGRMPKPKRCGARRIWDIRKIDLAFDALPGDEEKNPWDDDPRA